MTTNDTIEIDSTERDPDDTECPVRGCSDHFYSDDLLTDHLDDDHRLRERVLNAKEVVIRGE